ncbi:MAG: MtaA/CmuA family methyltransferase [Deltaproteobacteria bacterium]|nr:MtaA/CmuA family methyltransferase [Deltaproteobacteria bacterium]
MTPKERIFSVINQQKPDHMPVFGANSTVTYAQMEKVGAFWPEGHEKGEAMAKQALAAYTMLGFDAVRVPFCQTFEAEALGCQIKSGGTEGIPGIAHPTPYTLDDTPSFPSDFLSRGRIPELLKAVKILKKELGDEVPVVGGIIGPFTIAGSLVDTVPLLKATFKKPDKMHPFLELGMRAGRELAKALVDAGADIISVEDMTASPDLIAPTTYRDFEMDYQRRQIEDLGVPRILHICGNVDNIVEYMGQTGAEILSLEPKADAGLARRKCGPKVVLMGGVDTATVLFMKDPQTVKEGCEESIQEGIQMLAPGCAVAPGTPTENLLAMVAVARAH